MKKVFLGLLLVVVSFSAKAQTTEKTDDMDRIELCKKNYTALFGGEALNGEGTDPEIMDILQKYIFGEVYALHRLPGNVESVDDYKRRNYTVTHFCSCKSFYCDIQDNIPIDGRIKPLEVFGGKAFDASVWILFDD